MCRIRRVVSLDGRSADVAPLDHALAQIPILDFRGYQRHSHTAWTLALGDTTPAVPNLPREAGSGAATTGATWHSHRNT
jgi:hypothetical protein